MPFRAKSPSMGSFAVSYKIRHSCYLVASALLNILVIATINNLLDTLMPTPSTRREFLRQSVTAAVGLSLIGPSVAASTPTDLTLLTLAEAADLVRRRKVSPVELTQACLKRIELLNPKLNAFITLTAEQALAQAKQAEDEIKQGKYRGPLHGIPIGLKDNIDTAGTRTTVGSAVFKDRVPAEDAEIVRRLKQAGVVLLGKTNMEEFAWGTTSLTGFAGPVHNPWNSDYIAGGSSGGSAAALAAGMCLAAVGTDTGGSIRLPSSACNLTGLKPTYGLVSVRGVFPMTYSLDHAGPICRTVQDAALMLNVLAGFDPLASATVDTRRLDYSTFANGKKSALRIGLLLDTAKTTAVVQQRLKEALSMFSSQGGTIQEKMLPALPPGVWQILFGETYAIFGDIVQKQASLVNPKILPMISLGKETTMKQYVDGCQQLALLRHNADSLLQDVDVLVLPTAPTPPLRIADCAAKGTTAFVNDNVMPFNLLGLPAISIPCGFSSEGLPIGLQIIGPRFGEATVLAVAHQYQQATDWHKQHPQGLLATK
jgi:aspartyl-tRNA(Asn)/glutamyl-tRNA(Gln) amidotransferase subunit A